MIRIITGEAKGKKLKTREGDETRPTSERIKEAMFSSIQFDVEGRRVLDLFGGCGQLGLEAISRGAVGAMFVDSSAEAIALIKDNAKTVGCFDRCRYLCSDWRNYLRKAGGKEKFSLIFIDPPYAAQCCTEAVEKILERDLALPGALFVLESGQEKIDFSSDARFEVQKQTSYGKMTSLCILRYLGAEGESDGD